MWKIAIVFSAIFAEFVQLTVLADATCPMKPKVINPSVGAVVESFLSVIAAIAEAAGSVQFIIVVFVNNE